MLEYHVPKSGIPRFRRPRRIYFTQTISTKVITGVDEQGYVCYQPLCIIILVHRGDKLSHERVREVKT